MFMKSKKKFWMPSPAILYAASAVTKAYVGKTSQSNNISSGTVITFAQDFGSSSGVALLFVRANAGTSITSMVIDPTGLNISLTAAGTPDTNNGIENFYYGNVPSGLGTKNVTITFSTSIAFQEIGIKTWILSGLSSPVPVAYVPAVDAQHTAINVASGNFLFCGFNFTASSTFATSTSAPTNIDLTDANSFVGAADWSTPTPGTPFTVNPKSGSTTIPIAVVFS